MKRLLIPVSLISLLLVGCNKKTETPIFEHDEAVEKERLILHTDVQRAYLSDKVENVNLYARGVEELSRPLKPTFSWDGDNQTYTVYLSEKEDYSDSFTYTVEENKISFTNLKIDTTYYYKVITGDSVIKEDSFLTSDEIIRNMYVSGITNVRDLGGYVTNDGKTNQGLIFRTGRLNQCNVDTPTNMINEKGINTMLNEMKVKSEIDLRIVSNNEVGALIEGVGPLGPTVKYYQCPMDYNLGMDHIDNDPSLRKVFSILGDKNNYPTFFHCAIGTDRTGYIAWLINSCLGLEEEYIWRDYLFSNFGNIGGSRSKANIENGYVKRIKETRGNTLKEKATNFLLDKGVKQEEIDVLKEMMLPK